MKFYLFLILILSLQVKAVEKEYERNVFSVNFEQWTQPLYLKSYATQDEDVANFRGFNLNLSHFIFYPRWGWSYGLGYSQGQANGGGNSSVLLYQRSRQIWTRYEVDAAFYYKLNARLALGTQFILDYKKVDWPQDEINFITADNGNLMGVSALMQMNIRLTKEWDLTQAFGFYSLYNGSALCRIGLGYSWQ